MNTRRFIATLAARNREFLRDRMALSWNILLPVMIVMGFAFAFTSDNQDLFKVGVRGEPEGEHAFLAIQHIKFIPVDDLDEHYSQSGAPSAGHAPRPGAAALLDQPDLCQRVHA